jgi:hypothetical protein
MSSESSGRRPSCFHIRPEAVENQSYYRREVNAEETWRERMRKMRISRTSRGAETECWEYGSRESE